MGNFEENKMKIKKIVIKAFLYKNIKIEGKKWKKKYNYDNNIINDINKINEENNIVNKFKEILNIYKKMNNNEIELIYIIYIRNNIIILNNIMLIMLIKT